MRARPLFAFVACGALAGAVLLSACESTLDLGNGDAGATGAAFGFDGGTPATCAGVCDKVIACGSVASGERARCISECANGAPQALIDCAARTPCPQLQAACAGYLPDAASAFGAFDSGLAQFEIDNCRSACDSIRFFDCFTASEAATCRDLCGTATAAKRNTFQSCGSASPSNCTKSKDCYGVFVGD